MSEKEGNQFETDPEAFVTQESKDIEGSEDSGDSDKGRRVENFEDKPIKYSTHKKLLNQHKSLQSELDELRQFKTTIEEQEQMKKGEFEKILKNRDERINDLQSRLENVNRDITDGKKINAFLEKLPGKVKRNEYLSFVDLDEIAVDPESGKVDSSSVETIANKFAKEFPDLIEMAPRKDVPNYNVQGSQRPMGRKNLKQMTREELRAAYLRGEFAE